MSGGDDRPKSGPHLKQRLVVEYGIELDGVWLPIAMLRRLSTHGPWDMPFTEATADQERVLIAHSLADRHNRYGLHRGTGLSGFIEAIPFEPTVPFPAVPDEEPPAAGGAGVTATGIPAGGGARRGGA